jgi:uncharacterized membrane protein YqjE
MATEVESNGEAGVATLLSGIVQDARELFVEQLTLFQVEIKNDLRRTIAALAPLVAGVAVILASFILLGIGSAYLLIWAAPDVPLWVGFGIVGGLFGLAGALLVLWGKSMFDKVHLTPDSALKGLKENIQWKTKK